MTFDFFNLLFSFFSILILGSLVFLISKSKKERIFQSLDKALFLVTMPKYELKKEEIMKTEEKNLIGQMEQIYANFLNLRQGLFKRPPAIALEIASQLGGSDISFYCAVPKFLETAFEKYVQGVYPRALVEKIP